VHIHKTVTGSVLSLTNPVHRTTPYLFEALQTTRRRPQQSLPFVYSHAQYTPHATYILDRVALTGYFLNGVHIKLQTTVNERSETFKRSELLHTKRTMRHADCLFSFKLLEKRR
jgi:hypothetical protein